MVRMYGRGFTAAEKRELWDRWQRGESLKAAKRRLTGCRGLFLDLALQLTHCGIEPRRRGRKQKSVQSADFFKGPDRRNRQYEANYAAKRIAQDRGFLNIGQEPAPGPVVSVAHIVPGHDPFTRDLAPSRHDVSALRC